jgi:hypothetical protein
MREPLLRHAKGLLLGLNRLSKVLELFSPRDDRREVEAIGLLDLPPLPLRAKRLPFGLSRRMIRPQSTSTAICRRSVVAGMPLARADQLLVGGPDDELGIAGERRLRVEGQQRVEDSQESDPSRPERVPAPRLMSWNTCHLCTVSIRLHHGLCCHLT